MALKAVLLFFLLSLFLLTAFPGSLIPSAMAARDVATKSPPLPLLPGGRGENMGTVHRRPSPQMRVRREMDESLHPFPTPYPTAPLSTTHVPPDPCSYTTCGPSNK